MRPAIRHRITMFGGGLLGAVLILFGVLTMSPGSSVPASQGWQSIRFAEGWVSATRGLALHGDSIHVALRGGSDRDLQGVAYAHCGQDCANSQSWSLVELPVAGRAHPHMAVDAWGRPRIGIWADGLLQYAACDVDCHQASSWEIFTIERVEHAGPNGAYWHLPMDFGLDALGRPRFAYPFQRLNAQGQVAELLKYAECNANCLSPDAWETVILRADLGTIEWAQKAGLSFDGVKPRIGYRRWDKELQDESAYYAACEDNCLDPDNWGFVNVSKLFPLSYEPDIAVHGRRAHMVWLHIAQLYFATCDDDCLSPQSWSLPVPLHPVIEPERIYSPYLATTSDGNPRLAFAVGGRATIDTAHGPGASEDLHYASCDTLCALPEGWSIEWLPHAGERMAPFAIAIDGSRPYISHSDRMADDKALLTWCETCGEPGEHPDVPSEPPPDTGPGGWQSPDQPTPTPTPDPTPTEDPTTPPADTGGGDNGDTDSGGGNDSGDSGNTRSASTDGSAQEQSSPTPRPTRADEEPDHEASATEPPVQRVSGTDRVATAVAVSRQRFNPGLGWVFVANAGTFADALAGGPAAARMGAPVLLVGRDNLPAATTREIRRLRPERIAILGGHQSVGPAVEQTLADLTSHGTLRVSGPDRFATATAISRAWFPPDTDIVYLASGIGFADALAGGAAAVRSSSPTLLTAPDTLPTAARQELERLEPSTVIILGGRASVSDGVAAQVRALGPDVRRIAGPDRYSTGAAVVADRFPQRARQVFVTTGQDYPDALAAVPAAGNVRSPLLLVHPDHIPDAVAEELTRLQPSSITLLGGTRAISQRVERELDNFIRP